MAARPLDAHHSEAAEPFLHFLENPCGRLCRLRNLGLGSTAPSRLAAEMVLLFRRATDLALQLQL